MHARNDFEQINNRKDSRDITHSLWMECIQKENSAVAKKILLTSGPIQLTQIKVGKFQTKPLESHFLKTQSQVQRKVQIIKYAKMLEKLHCM